MLFRSVRNTNNLIRIFSPDANLHPGLVCNTTQQKVSGPQSLNDLKLFLIIGFPGSLMSSHPPRIIVIHEIASPTIYSRHERIFPMRLSTVDSPPLSPTRLEPDVEYMRNPVPSKLHSIL